MAEQNMAEVLYVVINNNGKVNGLYDSIPRAVAGVTDADELDQAKIYACVLNRKLVYPLKYASDLV